MSEFAKKDSLIERLSSKSGLRGKINAHCVMCIYDPAVKGNWKKQVGACTVESCPLYPIRAKSSSPDRMALKAPQLEANDDPVYHSVCPECLSDNILRCHHEGTFAVPECDYWECEDCGAQWGHE